MGNDQRDFFISFTSRNKKWADWVTYHLERKGYSVFYQHQDFPPGSDFMKSINNALANTKATIALWSNDYFSSRFGTLESTIALQQSISSNLIRLIPVRLEECEIDPIFLNRAFIDLVGLRDNEAQKVLIGGIEAALNSIKKATRIVRRAPKFPPYIENERFRDQSATKQSFSLEKPLRVLYAGSRKSSGLDLNSSFHKIETGISPHIKKGKIKFTKSLNLNTANIFNVLLKYQPHIFHFSGKQDGGDIRITDEANNVTTISDVALAGYLKSLGDHVKLVIVDTCFSSRCAKSISDVIEFAIGVDGSIYEEDADQFFSVFYNAIGHRSSLKNAVGQAAASLRFKQVPKDEIPVLFCKKGYDPAKAYFVHE
jgi:hypothetical protein